MDDLISRKALIEGRVENDPVVIAANCAPTVFDKEKVIEQLQEASYWESADIYDDDGYKDDYYDSEVIDLDKAIEIVEKGGIE